MKRSQIINESADNGCKALFPEFQFIMETTRLFLSQLINDIGNGGRKDLGAAKSEQKSGTNIFKNVSRIK